MDTTTKIEAIKKLLGLDFATPPVPEMETPEPSTTTEQEKSTATAKDGTIVSWDGELAMGSEITITTPSGEQSAPDGAIEFEDGTIIEVSGGKCTSVTPSAQSPAPEQGMSSDVSELKAENEALKSAMAKMSEDFKAEISNLKTAFSKTVEIVEAMNTTPAVKTPAPINEFFKKQDKTDAISKLAEAFNNLK